MLNLNDVKKYTGRFFYEQMIFGEDPLEYSVEHPLIDAVNLVKWLHSLEIYSETSLNEAIDAVNDSLRYMDRPCMDGIMFQDDEVGIFKDFPCEDVDKALEIACIIFSIYLSINFTEKQIVGSFFSHYYDYDNEFDCETNEEFNKFFEEKFDSSKFYPEGYIKEVDFSVIQEWNEVVYNNIMKLFDK